MKTLILILSILLTVTLNSQTLTVPNLAPVVIGHTTDGPVIYVPAALVKFYVASNGIPANHWVIMATNIETVAVNINSGEPPLPPIITTNYFSQLISVAKYANGNRCFIISENVVPTTNHAPAKDAYYFSRWKFMTNTDGGRLYFQPMKGAIETNFPPNPWTHFNPTIEYSAEEAITQTVFTNNRIQLATNYTIMSGSDWNKINGFK